MSRQSESDVARSEQRVAAERPAPAFYKRRKKRGNEIGQVLLRRGAVSPEHLREGLRIQREKGGLIGSILTRMGACHPQDIADALLEQVQLRRATAAGATFSLRARENPSIIGLLVRCQPRLTFALLISIDALVLFLVPLLCQFAMGGDASTGKRLVVSAAVTVAALSTFAVLQLYAVITPSPPEEIRRITGSLLLVYAGFSAIAWLEYSNVLAHGVRRGAWLTAWCLSVIAVPLARGVLRARFAKRPWWGQPIVVLGAGKVGRTVVGTLQAHPELGLKPVAILDDDPEKQGTLRASWGPYDIAVESVRDPHMSTPSVRAAWGNFSEVEGVPVVGGLDLAPALAQRLGIHTAVVAMPEVEAAALVTTLERVAESFNTVLVIPELFNIAQFGAPARSLGGVLGIEVRRQLLLTTPRVVKRAMDIVLTLIGAPFVLPILLFIGLLIKLDSRGSVLYRQARLGQDGVRFSALKFRTMYGDGEQRLAGLLASDPRLRAEYEQFHKLSVDPRVTRVGRFLRRYSLDEFPQLWNVLVGDMSLVGPRPYLDREIPDMKQREIIILRVKPGLTGIWQVTERNATSFDHRVDMDYEYVRNWTPWLDIYVLARTFLVLISGTGS